MHNIKEQYLPEYNSGTLWGTVIFVSLMFHVVVFAAGLILPGSWPSSSLHRPTIYNVNLVEMPSDSHEKTSVTAPLPGADTKPAIITESKPVERVPVQPAPQPTKAPNTVTVAKKVVEKPEIKKETPKEKPSDKLDQAIARLEKNVKKQESSDHLTSAISNIQKQVTNNQQSQDPLEKSIAKLEQAVAGSGGRSESSGTGISLGEHLYALQVEEKVKSYWSYPFEKAGVNPSLEALVLVRVNRDGSVLALSLIRSSGDRRFDESVVNAVERAKPLPPLPAGYSKSMEELELNFNLRDIERL